MTVPLAPVMTDTLMMNVSPAGRLLSVYWPCSSVVVLATGVVLPGRNASTRARLSRPLAATPVTATPVDDELGLEPPPPPPQAAKVSVAANATQVNDWTLFLTRFIVEFPCMKVESLKPGSKALNHLTNKVMSSSVCGPLDTRFLNAWALLSAATQS